MSRKLLNLLVVLAMVLGTPSLSLAQDGSASAALAIPAYAPQGTVPVAAALTAVDPMCIKLMF